jgi:hypothetical protein
LGLLFQGSIALNKIDTPQRKDITLSKIRYEYLFYNILEDPEGTISKDLKDKTDLSFLLPLLALSGIDFFD